MSIPTKIGNSLFKISEDGKSILEYNDSNKFWIQYQTAPQGKTFTDIRKSATGGNPEFKCDDGTWYENSVWKYGLTPTHEEQLKKDAKKRSKSHSKKKGSLVWRIVKGTFKAIFGILAFCIGYQVGREE